MKYAEGRSSYINPRRGIKVEQLEQIQRTVERLTEKIEALQNTIHTEHKTLLSDSAKLRTQVELNRSAIAWMRWLGGPTVLLLVAISAKQLLSP